ncbi:MAG: putative toxin-antitoxin system toxin component, PIN family [Chloroflexota bacterium]
MTRVVADTNVYISALLFGGLPGTFLDLALAGSFTLVISAALLAELAETLDRKFGVSPGDVVAIRAKLAGTAVLVEPTATLDVVPDDPDDNRVLECALAGQAEMIVSGDRHLRKLGAYAGIPIVTVRQFFEMSEASHGR